MSKSMSMCMCLRYAEDQSPQNEPHGHSGRGSKSPESQLDDTSFGFLPMSTQAEVDLKVC